MGLGVLPSGVSACGDAAFQVVADGLGVERLPAAEALGLGPDGYLGVVSPAGVSAELILSLFWRRWLVFACCEGEGNFRQGLR